MDVITKDEVVMVLRSEVDLLEARVHDGMVKDSKRMLNAVDVLLDRIKEIEGEQSW